MWWIKFCFSTSQLFVDLYILQDKTEYTEMNNVTLMCEENNVNLYLSFKIRQWYIIVNESITSKFDIYQLLQVTLTNRMLLLIALSTIE